jgi:hypothetical protein
MEDIHITLDPGQRLIIEVAGAPAEENNELPQPTPGISLDEYAALSPEPVDNTHPMWPTGPDGTPLPGDFIFQPGNVEEGEPEWVWGPSQ